MEALGFMTKKPTAKRTQRGWGPYRSVVRERSVEFNLTLDLQHLRQEIDEMLMTRDLLQSRALVQRHHPTGALAQTVKTYYEVFRQGFVTPDRSAAMASQQHGFLQSVLDQDIDVGNGLTGVDVMLAQGRSYAQLMRVISLEMDKLYIVEADDSVVVHSQSRFRFQIQPQMIVGIFPHVAGNERIMTRLIGQIAEVGTSMAFYFDSSDKIVKCDADMDFASMFLTLLQDPQDVAELLGQALIADNCMIGLEDGNATDSSPRIEILDESELTDANLSEDAPSNRATRSAIANAKTTSGSSMDENLAPRTTQDNTSDAMSMTFILG